MQRAWPVERPFFSHRTARPPTYLPPRRGGRTFWRYWRQSISVTWPLMMVKSVNGRGSSVQIL